MIHALIISLVIIKKKFKKKKGKNNNNVNPLEAGKEERRRNIEGFLKEFINLMIACNKPKTPPQPHPDGSSTKLKKNPPWYAYQKVA